MNETMKTAKRRHVILALDPMRVQPPWERIPKGYRNGEMKEFPMPSNHDALAKALRETDGKTRTVAFLEMGQCWWDRWQQMEEWLEGTSEALAEWQSEFPPINPDGKPKPDGPMQDETVLFQFPKECQLLGDMKRRLENKGVLFTEYVRVTAGRTKTFLPRHVLDLLGKGTPLALPPYGIEPYARDQLPEPMRRGKLYATSFNENDGTFTLMAGPEGNGPSTEPYAPMLATRVPADALRWVW